MIHRQAKLTEEELKKLAHLDVSIQHWSSQHTHLSLQAKATLDNIAGLTQARNEVMDRAIAEAKIDPKTIKQVNVSPDGTINCICAPPPPDAPQEQAVTNGAAPPAAAAPPAPAPVEGQSPTS